MVIKSICIIDGPNINLVGQREPDVYGNVSLITYTDKLRHEFSEFAIQYFQSNVEGEIINVLQECGKNPEIGVIINPGGYAHTSVAIADAIRAIQNMVIEVHISNVYSRETYRQTMITGSACRGIISGLGLNSYKLALRYFQENFD